MDWKYYARMTVGNKLFILSSVSFLIIEFFIGVNNWFIQSYFNDFIAPIIILTLTKLLISIYQNRLYKISNRQMLFFFIYLSLCFEVIFPFQSDDYIADFFDIYAYGAGTIVFHFMINKHICRYSN